MEPSSSASSTTPKIYEINITKAPEASSTNNPEIKKIELTAQPALNQPPSSSASLPAGGEVRSSLHPVRLFGLSLVVDSNVVGGGGLLESAGRDQGASLGAVMEGLVLSALQHNAEFAAAAQKLMSKVSTVNLQGDSLHRAQIRAIATRLEFTANSVTLRTDEGQVTHQMQEGEVLEPLLFSGGKSTTPLGLCMQSARKSWSQAVELPETTPLTQVWQQLLKRLPEYVHTDYKIHIIAHKIFYGDYVPRSSLNSPPSPAFSETQPNSPLPQTSGGLSNIDSIRFSTVPSTEE